MGIVEVLDSHVRLTEVDVRFEKWLQNMQISLVLR